VRAVDFETDTVRRLSQRLHHELALHPGQVQDAAFLTAMVVGAMVGGCLGSNGGSGQLTGNSWANTSLHVLSANVVDGTLRDVTVKNGAATPIPSGAWTFHLNGTSGGKPASHQSNVQATALGAGETRSLHVAHSSQPDWQDGTNLVILVTAPSGVTGDLTIRTA
jgi:hypothetical protein